MNEELNIIETLNAIIIDKSTKIKKEFVIVHEFEDNTKIPYSYEYDKETEEIIYIDVAQANSLYKAKWNGNTWEESATEEEIRQIEEERKKQFGNFEIDKNIISENEMLKAQNKALSDRLDFAEELIAELATKVY